MQMGIISFEASKTKTKTTIALGLIDYKTEGTDTAVTIEWQLSDKGWASPTIKHVTTEMSRLAEVGRIMTAVDKLKAKHKNAHKDPAALIHLLQKQLGRHVYLSNGKWTLVPKTSKENQWTDTILGLKVTASDEDQARTKLQKELGVAIADNMDKMDNYVAWLKSGSPVEETKNDISDIIPLSVYSRQSVDTKA